jgi:membrane-bound lytic murein transglycosylase B
MVPVGLLAAQDAPPVKPPFQDFLLTLREEARSRGISDATLDRTLDGLEPEPLVVAQDRTQPERTQSLEAYIAKRLTARTIATANAQALEHRDLLGRIELAYGLPAPMMLSIWGLESNFGKFTGTYPIIRALATLAYDGRRTLFRTELLNALTIVDRGQALPGDLRGSWAGAMGQPQFMPSSFLKHAVDFDGDGRIDIWTSEADVFGSMANYLKNVGWKAGERWGREVRVTRAVLGRIDRAVPMRSTGCRAIRELTVARPLALWTKLGVVLTNGAPLPASDIQASLVRGTRRHFLVYPNYEAILDYNCSNAYALSVGLLADKTSEVFATKIVIK